MRYCLLHIIRSISSRVGLKPNTHRRHTGAVANISAKPKAAHTSPLRKDAFTLSTRVGPASTGSSQRRTSPLPTQETRYPSKCGKRDQPAH